MISKEDLERMRKEAQAKRHAEGGKLPTEQIFNQKRSYLTAFKPSNANSLFAPVQTTDDTFKPDAKIALTNPAVSTSEAQCNTAKSVDTPCPPTLENGHVAKAVPAVDATVDGVSESDAATASNDSQSTPVSADIWASMTPRKLADEDPADICPIDERMVSAWKRKHFYGMDHDGTPPGDICNCGLMKSCCLTVSRMVARHDQMHLNLMKKYPTNKSPH